MDYLKAPLSFQLRKLGRYVRVFGPRTAAAKVEAELHAGGRRLPLRRHRTHTGHVGIIGCGKFAYSTIARYLRADHGDVLRGVMDTDADRAASLAGRYGASYWTTESDRLLDDPHMDLVYIASNHASHADYAITALERGLAVHIEKPHVISPDQLSLLCEAMGRSSAKVSLGFNRPLSPLGRRAIEALRSAGGPAMLNWFVAGHSLPADHWYYSEAEGGRVIGNLCHWTDFAYQAVPGSSRHSVNVSASRASEAQDDFIVSLVFADDSLATISFSAKGHTFEGVRERLSAHRGAILLALDDFRCLRIDEGHRQRVVRERFRDHGHRASIAQSYRMTSGGPGMDATYVRGTAQLFLAARDAVETGEAVEVPSPAWP